MDTANISTKPYLIRALYEWCLDCGCTPHLAVWVNEHTRVPAQYVQDNQIVLSISPSATKDLTIDNEWIHFHARFAGVSHEIWFRLVMCWAFSPKKPGRAWALKWKNGSRTSLPKLRRRSRPNRRKPIRMTAARPKWLNSARIADKVLSCAIGGREPCR